jgi:hypothetical protein
MLKMVKSFSKKNDKFFPHQTLVDHIEKEIKKVGGMVSVRGIAVGESVCNKFGSKACFNWRCCKVHK